MHGESKMMRWSIWGIFFLISTLSSSSSPAPAAFVGVQDDHFQLNGSPFLFNGFNSYWMMSVAADPNQRHKVTQVFRDAATAGLTVCRTWAFNDGGFHALQISPGVYDESVFQVNFLLIFFSSLLSLSSFLKDKYVISSLKKSNTSMQFDQQSSIQKCIQKLYFSNNKKKNLSNIIDTWMNNKKIS
uniref:Mannan endo-1,4-beta-mannosidase n=1 Tax=Cucumis sativus TaxID=3659 RepID=A0A0A0KXV4_CUCSA